MFPISSTTGNLMSERLSALEQAQTKAIDLGVQFGPKLVVALIILALGVFAARWVGRVVERMLARLGGRTHWVYTAVAVARDGALVSGVEAVEVTFRPLQPSQIRDYVATGEPMDKAGAYGIQGFGATLVERIHGDDFAVMGLALGRLVGLLREVGVTYHFRGLDAAR